MAFVKGQSGNTSGRPPGPDRYGLALLEKSNRKLLRQLIEKASGGDMRALEICADRLWPKMKPTNRPVEIPLADSLGDQGQEVLNAVFTGLIASDEASVLINALSAQAKLIEVSELVKRIEALEEFRGTGVQTVVIEKMPRRQLLPTT